MTHTLTTELLVIGAGPGGAAAARALAQAGHEVLMVDRATFPRSKTCGDGLTPRAVMTLDAMGALPHVEAATPARVEATRIVGPFGLSATMAFTEFMQPGADYALVLPRYKLDDILLRYAIDGGVHYQEQVRVEAFEQTGDRIKRVHAVGPDGPLVIHAQHVVIATGANMGLLRREGLLRRKPRVIRAARAYYTGVPNTGRFDFFFDLELLPGYGWVFPTGDGTANIGIGVLPVFWATRKPVPTLLNEFIARRQREGLLNGARQSGSIQGYPLRIDFPAQRVAGANWAIVGEATGLVNPVTGEGIDLALESGLLAAEVLHNDIRRGRGDHLAYQHDLWERFGPMFTGLRVLRDILLTPFFTDYALWLMNCHRFLTRTVMNMAQGFEPPQHVFHPLFIMQFFMPLPIGLLREELPRLLKQLGNGSQQ